MEGWRLEGLRGCCDAGGAYMACGDAGGAYMMHLAASGDAPSPAMQGLGFAFGVRVESYSWWFM